MSPTGASLGSVVPPVDGGGRPRGSNRGRRVVQPGASFCSAPPSGTSAALAEVTVAALTLGLSAIGASEVTVDALGRLAELRKLGVGLGADRCAARVSSRPEVVGWTERLCGRWRELGLDLGWRPRRELLGIALLPGRFGLVALRRLTQIGSVSVATPTGRCPHKSGTRERSVVRSTTAAPTATNAIEAARGSTLDRHHGRSGAGGRPAGRFEVGGNLAADRIEQIRRRTAASERRRAHGPARGGGRGSWCRAGHRVFSSSAAASSRNARARRLRTAIGVIPSESAISRTGSSAQ